MSELTYIDPVGIVLDDLNTRHKQGRIKTLVTIILDENGEPQLAGTEMDVARLIGLLEICKMSVISHEP